MGLGIGFGVNWGSIKLGLAKLLPSFALNFATISDDFTFTRSSFATRVNEFGLIETVTDLGSDLVRNGDFEEIGSELVQNGDFEEIGSELVTNGSFDTDSDWTHRTSSSVIQNGTLSWDGTQVAADDVFQQKTGYIGKLVEMTITISAYSQGTVFLRAGSSQIPTSHSSTGTFTETLEWVGNEYIYVKASSDFIGSIDNVSIKQVDPNNDWSFIGTANISDGVAIFPDSTSSYLIQGPVIPLTVKTYKLQYEVVSTNGGSFRLSGGNSAFGNVAIDASTVGVKTYYLTSNGTKRNLQFYNNTSFIGSIDNVSLKQVDPNNEWSLETGWIIKDGYAESTALNTRSIYQDVGNPVIGKTYQVTYTILETNGGNFRFAYGGVNGTIRNNVGTYTENIVATSSADSHIYFDALNVMIGKIDNIVIKEVLEDDVPRIDYSTGEAAFLLEPQSTNLITYSEDIEGSNWSTNSVATTINVTTSPDGTQNADLIQAIGSSSCYISDNTLTFTVGNTYTFSVFAKKGNNDWIRTAHVSSAINASWFDLENGVVGTVNGVSGTIEDFGNGWYKCTNTFVATQATSNLQLFIGICDADGSTNSGADGQNNYIWGAQVEELTYATSYIPTNGSTVTRSAELCVDATPTINSEEGVLYAEISALVNDETTRVIMISDGTNSNRVFIGYWSGSNQIRVAVQVGGATQLFDGVTSYDILNYNKIAFKYKENDFALWVNGVEVITDTSGITFPIGTLTQLDFDSNGIATFYGNTKDLKIYNKALTDSELEKLTTI